MERLRYLLNFASGVRKAKRGGRDYLVAPVTLIASGVLNGSRGPLYYPVEEVAHNPSGWNGMPLVLRHPTVNGQPVSARNPQVLEECEVGQVFNVYYSDKLRGEAWFDVAACNKADRRIIPALKQGKALEVSTGLFAEYEDAPEGAAFNGTVYTHTVRNIRPDHLALLLDESGACSVKDGCGVLANSGPAPSVGVDVSPINNKKMFRTFLNWLKRSYGSDRNRRKPSERSTPKQKKSSGSGKKEPVGKGKEKVPAGSKEKVSAAKGGDAPTDNKDLSHSEIRHELTEALSALYTQDQPRCYVVDVFDDFVVYEQGVTLYKVGYKIAESGGVSLTGTPTAVEREINYVESSDPEPSMLGMGGMSGMDMGGMGMNRKQAIDFVVANCDCWKGPEASGVLERMPDGQLTRLVQGVQNVNQKFAILDNLKGVAGDAALTANSADLQKVLSEKFKTQTSMTVTTSPGATTVIPANNQQVPVAPVVTPENRLTPEEQATINWASQEMARQKADCVNRLTAHAIDPNQKQALAAVYNAMPLPQLQVLANSLPQQQVQQPQYPAGYVPPFAQPNFGPQMGYPAPFAPQQPQQQAGPPLYLGAGGGPVGNTGGQSQEEFEDQNVLPIPTINWQEGQKKVNG